MAETLPFWTAARLRLWLVASGSWILLVGLLVVIWDWNWFRPLVEREASAKLGREFALRHFDLHPGRRTVVIAEGLQIANAPGFGDAPFASIDRLTVTLDVMEYLRHRTLIIPDIEIETPLVDARQHADGSDNYSFAALNTGDSSGPASKVCNLRIFNGSVHIVLAKLRADLTMAVHTREPAQAALNPPVSRMEASNPTPLAKPGTTGEAQPDLFQTAGGQVIADVKGTYAAQPISGQFTGGELLALRDPATPYPIAVRLQNGPTHVTLVGTIQNPLDFTGANVKLEFSGTDMALLLPITGIPFPKTPSYQIKGNLDYTDTKIHFHQFAGKVGSSDMEGDIDVDPAPRRPVVTADVRSRQLDLADLGGFVGSEPGRISTPNQTPEQKQAVARAEADPRLLPTTTISLPKLRAADVHLKYRGAKIQGRNMPFDSFAADMDIVDGHIALHPVSLGVGQGRITASLDLSPLNDTEFRTKGDIAVQRVDLGRMLSATHVVKGSGLIGGRATIDTTGNSTATMLGNGNGSLLLTMAGGGSLSALAVDLSGLQFGNALLSALGIPNRDQIECFVGDFTLHSWGHSPPVPCFSTLRTTSLPVLVPLISARKR